MSEFPLQIGEINLLNLLKVTKIPFIPQMIIGPYTADIYISNISACLKILKDYDKIE